jgi:hypothetical protein
MTAARRKRWEVCKISIYIKPGCFRPLLACPRRFKQFRPLAPRWMASIVRCSMFHDVSIFISFPLFALLWMVVGARPFDLLGSSADVLILSLLTLFGKKSSSPPLLGYFSSLLCSQLMLLFFPSLSSLWSSWWEESSMGRFCRSTRANLHRQSHTMLMKIHTRHSGMWGKKFVQPTEVVFSFSLLLKGKLYMRIVQASCRWLWRRTWTALS